MVLVAVALVALAAVGALTYLGIHSRLAPGPPLVGRTVELQTRRPDDQTLRGHLRAQHADRWTLTEVVYRHPSGDQVPEYDVVHVPVANIAWVGEPRAE